MIDVRTFYYSVNDLLFIKKIIYYKIYLPIILIT